MSEKEATMPEPLLIVSDGISSGSGLGRIAGDLATRVHLHVPEIRLGTAGYGGVGTSKAKWADYHFNTYDNWLLPEIPQVVNDFAGTEKCIILFVWDLSRLYWFADPKQCPDTKVRNWISRAKIKKWAYHPVDAEGPNGKLSARLTGIMKGFDRTLDYSAFSSRVTGNPDHLPHGIDTSVFKPHPRLEARRQLRRSGFKTLKDDSFVIGIVATNQVRKDWALGIETCAELLRRGHDLQLWAHIDVLDRHWNLPNLIADFGLHNRVVVTNHRFTDEQMAWLYANCNVTLGIGSEGFGYPIFESLACGVPCISGNYAGAAEHLPPSMKIEPIAYRYEGPYNCKRPVFNAADWADAAEQNKGIIASLPDALDWNGRTLWPACEKWFREGLAA